MVDKAAVVDHIRKIGQLYEMQGGDAFKAKSFLNAARTLAGADFRPEEIKPGCFTGIGEGVAITIQEFVATGTSKRFEELERALPPILELLDVPGIGPKTAMSLHMQHGIKSVDELEELLRSNKLKNPKMLASIEFLKAKGGGRIPREKVVGLVESMVNALRAIPGVQKVEPAGSYRRKLATVKDVDVLVCAPGLQDFVEAAVKNFATVEASGHHRLTLRAQNPVIQVDVLFVEPQNWGAALNYFTGSKDHVVKLRALAKARGLTVNEYGVWASSLGQDIRIGGDNEEDLYNILEIPFVLPENRV